MNTALQHSHSTYYPHSTDLRTVWSRFISWCDGQEKNRFLWLSIGLLGHGCFLTPFTLMIVMLSGNSMFLWALAIAAMGMCLVTNLAALTTRITIPVFFLSMLIDLGIILTSLVTVLAVAI